MFLIINNKKILPVKEDLIKLGLSPSLGLVFNDGNVTCRLSKNGTSWSLTSLIEGLVQFNRTPLPINKPMFVGLSDEILLGSFSIQIKYYDSSEILEQTFHNLVFELQKEVHNKVLDILRIKSSGLTEKQQQESVNHYLGTLFSNLKLSAELERYLLFQSIDKILVDRLYGYEPVNEENSLISHSKLEKTRVNEIVAKLVKDLCLDEESIFEDKIERINTLLRWAIQINRQLISDSEKRALAIGFIKKLLLDIIFGLGPLEDLMYASDINDIMVLPSGSIFIERKGKILDSGRSMLNSEISQLIVERIVSSEGRRIDQSSPMVDSRVADGSRLNAIIAPVSVNGPALTIRRFSQKKLGLKELVKNNSMPSNVEMFLTACIIARKNIIIAGGTGSGKTTLLNALASGIPTSERIIVVEDTNEIQLIHKHVIYLQAKPANLEGKSAVTIRQLVRNTLRMRPDRIIVGECRSGETLDMLQAMNTGHDGSLTTIHANTPKDCVHRLEVMSMEAEGVDLPVKAIREQIASAINLIVQISRFADGVRRVVSICEVVGLDEETGSVIVEEIFTLWKSKNKSSSSQPKLIFTGYVPNFIDELLETGVVKTEDMF